MRGAKNKSIVVVVSPLTVSKIEEKMANFNLFTSPESLFMSMEWKNTLSSKVYRDNLVG